MSQIDLPSIVQRWMYSSRENLGRPMFPALKLKLTNVQWSRRSETSQPLKGATRSFEMRNESPAPGTGHLQTVKDGRPITTVTIERGVITGYPNLTRLPMPQEIQAIVGEKANVEMGHPRTQRVEPSILQVDAAVQLGRNEHKVAIVENTDIQYNGHFTATAILSGKVLFENSGEMRVEQIFNDMGASTTWPVRGQLTVNFEDNQKLLLHT